MCTCDTDFTGDGYNCTEIEGIIIIILKPIILSLLMARTHQANMIMIDTKYLLTIKLATCSKNLGRDFHWYMCLILRNINIHRCRHSNSS